MFNFTTVAFSGKKKVQPILEPMEVLLIGIRSQKMELNSRRPVFRLEAGLPRSDNMKYDGKRKVRMLNEILARKLFAGIR